MESVITVLDGVVQVLSDGETKADQHGVENRIDRFIKFAYRFAIYDTNG